MRKALAVVTVMLASEVASAHDVARLPDDVRIEEEDARVDPAEPDFTLVNLPTNLRLPRHRLAFRVTHRFARPLGVGDFGDLAADLFGLDGGGEVGLGLRFGLRAGTQIGIHRTSDRTIELSAQQGVLRSNRKPVGLAVRGTLEGRDNLGEEHSAGLGLVFSRRLGSRAALYLVPYWVHNTDLRPGQKESTLMMGVGARLRLGPSAALLGEVTPRLAGFAGPRDYRGAPLASFALERVVGGHAFQINVSNGLGTTPAALARGRVGPDDWFIGFNLSRKFY